MPAGEFPFRITAGADESRYLTWLRNHSSYMTVRGLLDYFRAIGVLLRGVLVNLLVGLPYLLVLAVVVAVFRVRYQLPPFYLTLRVVMVAGLSFALFFPTQSFLTKLRRSRRSLETGTESSVKERDALERGAGRMLMVVLAVAAFEALPLLLDHYHRWASANAVGTTQLASLMGALLTAFSLAHKLRSALPGPVAKRLASVALGAFGVLVPLLIVLLAADFVAWAPPPNAGDTWMKVSAWCLPALILIGLVIGAVSRAFSIRDALVMCVLLAGSIALALLTLIPSDAYVEAYGRASHAREAAQKAATADQLKQRDDELRSLMNALAEHPGPLLAELLDHIDKAKKEPSARLKAEHAALRGERPAHPPVPARSPREQIDEHLRSLGDRGAAYTVSGLPAAVAAVRSHLRQADEGAARGELESALRLLRERVALLDPLFAFERSALVSRVLQHSAQELERMHGPAPFRDLALLPMYRDASDPQLYPICGQAYYDVVLHLAKWSELVEGARREVADSVVYSSESQHPTLFRLTGSARDVALGAKSMLVLTLALLLLGFCWLTVDVNLTSIHGLYRDRLASAFLVGLDTKGDVDIEDDLDLEELSRHEAGSIAPYHLINVALNLQGSRDIGLRDRRSDFFIFSKLFIGGKRTGYCRSEALERVFPQMSLATAMAISAAAASPNMGRATSPALVALMTLLNIRLGIWVPNPGLLAQAPPGAPPDPKLPGRGLGFEQVFAEELEQVERRWQQLGARDRTLADLRAPTVQHALVGLAFSGGGIRSATVNLGIAQALDRAGVFPHFDYMSTVSGGGYLGSSISALMRSRVRTVAEIAGRVDVRDEGDHTVVRITPDPAGERTAKAYRYARGTKVAVADGARVQAGQRLLAGRSQRRARCDFFGEQFRWQVPPRALLWEMTGELDENKRWVNLSDGGHIENLATLELLRRHCKYVVIGDAEADPEHRFNGLSTLIRTARIDLGIRVDIDVTALRLGEGGRSQAHWAVGRIHYPGEAEHGYLLYLKSSICGDEDEVIREYRHGSRDFPHEPTADQMFDEGQFEAYRSLGQHIGEAALGHLAATLPVEGRVPFADLERWFQALLSVQHGAARSSACAEG